MITQTRTVFVCHQLTGVDTVIRHEKEGTTNEFLDPETGEQMELIDSMPLIEWFAENYKSFGTTLEIITNKSQEGSQFCKGFGGIGGLLRYVVDFTTLDEYSDDE